MTYETYEMRVYSNGTKSWYQNGKLHRTDGPAIEGANGTKSWYQNGELHRTDGPAIEYADGHKDWWIEGTWYTEEEFLRITQPDPCANKVVEMEGKRYRLVPE